MPDTAPSPYLRALGTGRAGLHPNLSTYFEAVPPGGIGIGEGVFQRAGTRRRWLWPVYRMLQARGAVLAGWHEDVPFTVRNRTVDGSAVARRTFHLPEGDWVMRDVVSARANGTVVDQLGEPQMVAAAFRVRVEAGALLLRSTAVGIRVGRLRIRMPKAISPVIRLRESFDDATRRQRVELSVDVPLLGRVYEYDGTFAYRVEQSADGTGESV
ncbi:DUF4166 domain-containing protein [Microbacterium sp.]|uniref:DUF4166 domain-containing protein n=1 Tax=Microbacterium sp. TaxID=51671 RepID=UPI002811F807|nr:DUF4166 domain-containing protein [Microbacterium sp.]